MLLFNSFLRLISNANKLYFFSCWSFGSVVSNFACSAFFFYALFLTSRKRAPWVCLAQRVLLPGCLIPVVWVLGVEDADQGNKSLLPLSPPNHWLSHPVFLAHGNRFLNFTSLNIFPLAFRATNSYLWGHLIPCISHQSKSFCFFNFEFLWKFLWLWTIDEGKQPLPKHMFYIFTWRVLSIQDLKSNVLCSWNFNLLVTLLKKKITFL